jgi:hypothetical protein
MECVGTSRGAFSGALLVAALCVATPAGAQTALQRCIDTHEAAQLRRKDGALLEAKTALETCSMQACPEEIAAECRQWLLEVEEALPTVLIDARDAKGRALRRVRVLLDGRVLKEELDTTAVHVLEGRHVLRLEHEGHTPVEKSLEFRAGEKGRRVEVVFRPRATAPRAHASPEPASVSPAVWVVGSVGIAASAVAIGFGIRGWVRHADLEDRACKPNCPQEDVDALRRELLIGDVLGGIGIASLAAATIVFFVTRENGEKSSFSPLRVRF